MLKRVLAVLSLASSLFFAGQVLADWQPSAGYDCKVTCDNFGGGWKSGTTPTSSGAWGDRDMYLCKATFGSIRVYGYNLAAKPGSNIDSNVCNIGWGNSQHKLASYTCRCSN